MDSCWKMGDCFRLCNKWYDEKEWRNCFLIRDTDREKQRRETEADG